MLKVFKMLMGEGLAQAQYLQSTVWHDFSFWILFAQFWEQMTKTPNCSSRVCLLWKVPSLPKCPLVCVINTTVLAPTTHGTPLCFSILGPGASHFQASA